MTGGFLYGLLEVLWRGHTHPSMIAAGGICLNLMYAVCRCCKKTNYICKCLLCAGIITAVEFCFGCVFNLWLNMAVWDYSDRFANLLGQVCAVFTVIWFLLSLPVVFVIDKIIKKAR